MPVPWILRVQHILRKPSWGLPHISGLLESSQRYCWWIRNPAPTHQLRLVGYPIIYKVLAPSQVVGLGISEPSTLNSRYGFFGGLVMLVAGIYPKNQLGPSEGALNLYDAGVFIGFSKWRRHWIEASGFLGYINESTGKIWRPKSHFRINTCIEWRNVHWDVVDTFSQSFHKNRWVKKKEPLWRHRFARGPKRRLRINAHFPNTLHRTSDALGIPPAGRSENRMSKSTPNRTSAISTCYTQRVGLLWDKMDALLFP